MAKELVLDLGDTVSTQRFATSFKKKKKKKEQEGGEGDLYCGPCLQEDTLPVKSVILHRLQMPFNFLFQSKCEMGIALPGESAFTK